jgi:hypothetical protein
VEFVDVSIARKLKGKHVSVAKDMHGTMEEVLDAVFSVQSVPRLYNKDTS